jgi:sugar lactone lactonase YvrE
VAAILMVLPGPAAAQDYQFSTFAGGVSDRSRDGAGGAARFNLPQGVALDSQGTVYVADANNHTIRKIDPTGVVTTLAGTAHLCGRDDGAGSAARFCDPLGVAVDSHGIVYVADSANSLVRAIAPGGAVTTLAGSRPGSEDGIGAAGRFRSPQAIAVDGSGTVYVADTSNFTIRKVTPGGVVSTLAGLAGVSGSADGLGSTARFSDARGIAVDGAGTVYVADYSNHTIRRITAAGLVSTLAGAAGSGGSADGRGNAARFAFPTSITVNAAGTLFVSDAGNSTVRQVTGTGLVTTIAGLPGTSGSADGSGSAARFNSPRGIAVDAANVLVVADSDNSTIRKIAAAVVTTFAGTAATSSVDGRGAAARFNHPSGVAADRAGNVYLADGSNRTIRKITAAGAVSTLAGAPGVCGSSDGVASAARFCSPTGIAVDNAGNLFVTDDGSTIRRITPSGAVSTLAGSPGMFGSVDGGGSDARFNDPHGIAVDSAGVLYVAESGNHTVRRITPAGIVTTIAGSAGMRGSADGTGRVARFDSPADVALDAAGNVFVADAGNSTIRKITVAGVVTTLAGTAGMCGAVDGVGTGAQFCGPSGLALDLTGNVYVTDAGSTIRRISPAGVVSTLGGRAGTTGIVDGDANLALFNHPVGIAAAGAGKLYVADSENDSVRLGTTATTTSPADFDGDGRSDVTVFRPSTGQWFVRRSSQGYGLSDLYAWGLPGDLPIAGDMDGDGLDDLIVYRPSTGQWLVRYSSQNFDPAASGSFQWGLPGDVPLALDLDGDGRLDITVYRPSTSEWLARYSSRGYDAGAAGAYQWGLPGDTPLPGDFDGDGLSDLVVYRPATGQWFISFSSRSYSADTSAVYQWGLSGDVPLVADFDGDGRIDLTVYRPSTSQWLICYSTQNYSLATAVTYQWGLTGDVPLVLDLDGDGRSELTVFRPGTGEWLMRYSSLGFQAAAAGVYQWGLPGDVPLPTVFVAPPRASEADLTLYRPSTGYWFVAQHQRGTVPAATLALQWGLAGDTPLFEDFDGDGQSDIAVFRPSTGEWFIRYSSQGYTVASAAVYQWGIPGDVPIGADIDGDGRADLLIYRPSSGEWFVRYSRQGYSTSGVYQWGLVGDLPIAGDFDGDGRSDLSVYRPSTGQWFIVYSGRDYSAASHAVYQVGVAGDIPLAGDFDGDGRSELTVYRPATGYWRIRYSSQNYSVATARDFQWGLPSDLPLVRDFDGDGRADLTVFRPSTSQWFIHYSQAADDGEVLQWGLPGDLPIPSP